MMIEVIRDRREAIDKAHRPIKITAVERSDQRATVELPAGMVLEFGRNTVAGETCHVLDLAGGAHLVQRFADGNDRLIDVGGRMRGRNEHHFILRGCEQDAAPP